jgi:alpha-methylacyl-CoA racemase
VAVDLKQPAGRAAVARLIDGADILIEGFRPGVMERLGLGPECCLARNPRLVYARATGWGQDGPLRHAAGHDINYLALTGVLNALGRPGAPPAPPLNLLGDYAGGGLTLAFGIACAIVERAGSGRGQVIDGAMVDGVSMLSTLIHGLRSMGNWSDERGSNLYDGAAPYYEVYETADGLHMAVGAIEPQFYAELVRVLGLADDPLFARQNERSRWPAMKTAIAAAFRTRTRDAWAQAFHGVDACVSPVLDWTEAASHPHNRARSAFVDANGVLQPAPAPRLSRTPAALDRAPPRPGEHTRTALADWGFAGDEIEALLAVGAIADQVGQAIG